MVNRVGVCHISINGHVQYNCNGNFFFFLGGGGGGGGGLWDTEISILDNSMQVIIR